MLISVDLSRGIISASLAEAASFGDELPNKLAASNFLWHTVSAKAYGSLLSRDGWFTAHLATKKKRAVASRVRDKGTHGAVSQRNSGQRAGSRSCNHGGVPVHRIFKLSWLAVPRTLYRARRKKAARAKIRRDAVVRSVIQRLGKFQ